ncbi:MAG: adenylate/guanylate cyclase domain-containing protein, partial [Bacteroidota bacterium]
FGLLPSDPRCKLCASPFKGWGGALMRLMGREQSRYNPRFCLKCEPFEHPGGAEVVITMFFADVRGSTRLAEQMSAREFRSLMDRFYRLGSHVLINSDAMVDRLLGDEVVGLYAPGMAGKEHPRRAVEAARQLLELTGHRDRGGPWLPVGIGVHTGPAYVGIVGGSAGEPQDFTALGDNVNITARLASLAGPGEILISEAAYEAAGLGAHDLESRQLDLKGKSGPTAVRVMRVSPA